MQPGVLAAAVSEDFERAVGDHLVDVHVGRRARTSLDDVYHELVGQAPGGNLVAGLDNRARLGGRQQAEIAIGMRRSFLDERIGAD